MNTESADCVLCKTPKEFDAHGAGAVMADDEVLEGVEHQAMFIYVRLPGNIDAGAIQVTRDPSRSEPRVWHIEGSPEQMSTFSLRPSVHLVGEWHGYLRNGRLESC